jgi:hypothetical protein
MSVPATMIEISHDLRIVSSVGIRDIKTVFPAIACYRWKTTHRGAKRCV